MYPFGSPILSTQGGGSRQKSIPISCPAQACEILEGTGCAFHHLCLWVCVLIQQIIHAEGYAIGSCTPAKNRLSLCICRMFGIWIQQKSALCLSLRLCQHFFVRCSYSFFGVINLMASTLQFQASPITGLLTDKFGAEWVTVCCLILALPWWGIAIIQHRLALFIVAYAVESESKISLCCSSCHPDGSQHYLRQE